MRIAAQFRLFGILRLARGAISVPRAGNAIRVIRV
jgi:hypothetical protein